MRLLKLGVIGALTLVGCETQIPTASAPSTRTVRPVADEVPADSSSRTGTTPAGSGLFGSGH